MRFDFGGAGDLSIGQLCSVEPIKVSTLSFCSKRQSSYWLLDKTKKGEASLNADAHCRARVAALKYRTNMVVVGW